MKTNIENSELFQKGLRRCARCGEVKPLAEFNKNTYNNGGLSSYCKTCTKEYNHAYSRAKREERKAEELKKLSLDAYADTDLIRELRARGWEGELYQRTRLTEAGPVLAPIGRMSSRAVAA